MKVTLCDRCGKTFDTIKRGEQKYMLRYISGTTVNKKMSRGSGFDLCPDCYKKLIKWIDMEE